MASKWIRYWQRYRRSSGVRHELTTLGLCLVLGLLLVPTAIWLVGRMVLGPYTKGGWGALLADYFSGLAHGSLAFWLVAAGPYALVWCWRLLRRIGPYVRGQ